eukprot:gene26251-32170_t
MSPPGNGIDTHRTWEALMAGAIPVVFANPAAMLPLYNGLPVLVIQDCKNITKSFLANEYTTIIEQS